MQKCILSRLAAAVLALVMLTSQSFAAVIDIEQPVLELPCKNAVLVSTDTGDVLYEKGADEEVAIASITKVMTLLLTLEAVEDGKISMTDIVPVSAHAYGMGGSQIWLEPGEQFTLDELIKAICVCSANDAAVAVAEFVGGSEEVFAEMMNTRAKELGMEHTHFMNACGLDEEGHYSCAGDVAKMSAALLAHPKILEYSQIWMDSLRGGATQLLNTNKLLKTYSGTTGLKTGTTDKAGVCISASATRDGSSFLAVVLGSASGEERFESAKVLLDYAFSTYEYAEFPVVEAAVSEVKVKHGALQTAELSYEIPQGLLMKKGDGKKLTAKCTAQASVDAPAKTGDVVGTVTLYNGDAALCEYPVTVAASVERMNFSSAIQLLAKGIFSL